MVSLDARACHFRHQFWLKMMLLIPFFRFSEAKGGIVKSSQSTVGYREVDVDKGCPSCGASRVIVVAAHGARL
jgi:rubredoxin